MFDEMKRAIEAAESMENHLEWWKTNVLNEIDRLLEMEDRDEWDEARLKEYLTKMDLYNEIHKCIMKWTKAQI